MKVRMILEDLKKHLVKGEKKDGHHQIFPEKPHSTWNDFFSDDDINEWIGQNNFGVTITCCQDRLPRGVSNHFLHKVLETAPGDKKACVACFNNPINVVKCVAFTPPAVPRTTEGENALPTLPNTPINYTRVHVTFQSTSVM
jgi:hypothetical protein